MSLNADILSQIVGYIVMAIFIIYRISLTAFISNKRGQCSESPKNYKYQKNYKLLSVCRTDILI
jgi:hypothetical protein